MDAIRFHLMWMTLVMLVSIIYCAQRLLVASLQVGIYNRPFDTLRVDAIPLLQSAGKAQVSQPLVVPTAQTSALQTSMSILMLVLSIWTILLILTMTTIKDASAIPTSFTDFKTLFAMNVTRLTSLRGIAIMMEEMLDVFMPST